MSRWDVLHRRAANPEYMDESNRGGEEYREAMRHLRRLNRVFGAAGPVLYGVKRLWEASGKPARLTLLDVGSGSGDINRRILKWADRRGIGMNVILADVTEEARAEAELLFRKDSRVRFVKQDVFDLRGSQADIVTASQFLHHFPPEKLPHVMERMLAVSRLGVVVGDIHRHLLPWLTVWIAVRCLSRNRYIRHDGPLSVAKGFRGSDLRRLAASLGLPGLVYSWRPLFRYAVIVPKRREDGANGRNL